MHGALACPPKPLGITVQRALDGGHGAKGAFAHPTDPFLGIDRLEQVPLE